MVKHFSEHMRDSYYYCLLVVRNSDFPQPPPVTPRDETLSRSGRVRVMATVSPTAALMAGVTTTGVQ